jgi:hypothetical protein
MFAERTRIPCYLSQRLFEAVNTVSDKLTFACPINEAYASQGWKIVSIDNVTSAVDGSVVDLTYDEEWTNTDISAVDCLTGGYGQVAARPAYGPMATDKETYNGNETINVTLPIQDIGALGGSFPLDFVLEWTRLSLDGGLSFINPLYLRWDAAYSVMATGTSVGMIRSPANRLWFFFTVTLRLMGWMLAHRLICQSSPTWTTSQIGRWSP